VPRSRSRSCSTQRRVGPAAMSRGLKVFNFFKHVPDDLVMSSTSGMIISLVGTVLMVTLFLFELNEYFAIKATTQLIVDEFRDETLRVNFNLSMAQVPCEFLGIDVSDMTGTNRHNISKDILKWRLDSHGRIVEHATATAARTAAEVSAQVKHETHGGAFDEFDPDEYEPPDTNLSQALTADSFVPSSSSTSSLSSTFSRRGASGAAASSPST